MPVIVRQATALDVAAIAGIEREAFGNDRGARALGAAAPDDPAPTEAWVAVGPGGTVLGFVSGRLVAGELEVIDVAVRVDRRGRGIGRHLLAEVLAAAGERGATRVVLEVARSNRAARKVYESLGFRASGVRPGYYRDGTEDALVLARTLD